MSRKLFLSAVFLGISAQVFENAVVAGNKVDIELPRSWSLIEIEKASLGKMKGRVYVLAWQIVEDERPLRIERCLILLKLEKDTGLGAWHLQHYYCHPSAKSPNWTISEWHVMDRLGRGEWKLGEVSFKKTPTNKNIYDSLKAVNWNFGLEKGWRYVGCGVCEKTWASVVGERPIQFFGK